MTLEGKPGEKPEVVSSEEGETTTEEGEIVESVDDNGNPVKDITGTKLIMKEISTSVSLRTVIRTKNEIRNSEVIAAKTIAYETKV